MRHIVLDTETTGFDPQQGHRIVEIGCVELVNYIPTGKTYQVYLNPEREVPKEAQNVHGLTDAFLADKPLFAQVVDEFLEFISEDPLVIHNATFDMAFLNAELTRLGFTAMPKTRAIDTVIIARKLFPGAPASLDALCKRFNVDASSRNYHGALLDARLLADVYLELSGGKQAGLNIEFAGRKSSAQSKTKNAARAPRVFEIPPDELAAHEAAIEKISNAVWKKA